MFKNPFSFNGRIRRTEYGLSFIFHIIAIEIGSFVIRENNDEAVLLSFVIFIPLLWFILAQGAKRCHDIGKNGWWQLIPFFVLALIFEKGEPGSNKYGMNPKGFVLLNGKVYKTEKTSSDYQNDYGYHQRMSSDFINTYQQEVISDNTDGYQGGYSGGHNNPQHNSQSHYNPEPRYIPSEQKRTDGYKDGDLYK